jgi:hypothetical protein
MVLIACSHSITQIMRPLRFLLPFRETLNFGP